MEKRIKELRPVASIACLSKFVDNKRLPQQNAQASSSNMDGFRSSEVHPAEQLSPPQRGRQHLGRPQGQDSPRFDQAGWNRHRFRQRVRLGPGHDLVPTEVAKSDVRAAQPKRRLGLPPCRKLHEALTLERHTMPLLTARQCEW